MLLFFVCFLWRCSPMRAMASSFLRFLDHTQRRITVGRTPLGEWSARRRDLYLTTHNTHNRRTSVPSVGFEPTISAGERAQTYALDRAATGTGWRGLLFNVIAFFLVVLRPNTDFGAPHSWGFKITQRRTTVGRNSLDELSARRRNLYLTAHNTHNRQTSMPPVGFGTKISAGERAQNYALDRAANGTGFRNCSLSFLWQYTVNQYLFLFYQVR